MDGDHPEITILLLGDEGIGKSTFLSRLSLGIQPDSAPPPYALPVLRDLDQPFQFNIKMYGRAYSFSFYDTSSPTNYTLLRPDFIILCYDITRRETLDSLSSKWTAIVEAHFNYDDAIPVMVLGLKRDLRREWTEEEEKNSASGKGTSVMPLEAVNLAQELRSDRYAECSAISGELCKQVLEDIARTAAKTVVGTGRSEPGCVMI